MPHLACSPASPRRSYLLGHPNPLPGEAWYQRVDAAAAWTGVPGLAATRLMLPQPKEAWMRVTVIYYSETDKTEAVGRY